MAETMNSEWSGTNWRAPLYECAEAHRMKDTAESLCQAVREYAFLGDYLDSPAMLEKCREKTEIFFREAAEETFRVRSYEDALLAVRKLEGFRGVFDCGAQIEQARERCELLRGRTIRNRRIRRCVMAAGAAVLVLGAVFALQWRRESLLPQRVEQVRRLSDAGEYDKAILVSRKLLAGPQGEWAEQTIQSLIREKAYLEMENGNYSEAVWQLKEAHDWEGVRYVNLMWGKQLLQEKEYESAAGKFVEADADQWKEAAYYRWSRDLEAQGEYEEALRVLDKVQDGPAKTLVEDRLTAVLEEGWRASALAAARTKADRLTVWELNSLGGKVTDLETQLEFCRILDEKGVNVGEVYPDGVGIKGLSLEACSPFNQKEVLSDEEIQEGKYLVFSRVQKVTDRGALRSSTALFAPTLAEHSNYYIRLMPAELYALPREKRAASLEECTHILLMDSCYLKKDMACVTVRDWETSAWSPQNLGASYYYPMYAAFDSVAIYDRKDPGRFRIIASQETPSKEQEESAKLDKLLSQGKETEPLYDIPYVVSVSRNDDLTRFWGESDPDFLKKALVKGVMILHGI